MAERTADPETGEGVVEIVGDLRERNIDQEEARQEEIGDQDLHALETLNTREVGLGHAPRPNHTVSMKSEK